MGQAESSTVKSSQDEESIYFQTSLVVEGERLSPIAYYKESADDANSTASSAFFCAEAGSKFEIKVTLARPPPEGVLYGARVYVDSGAPDVVYEACGPGRRPRRRRRARRSRRRRARRRARPRAAAARASP